MNLFTLFTPQKGWQGRCPQSHIQSEPGKESRKRHWNHAGGSKEKAGAIGGRKELRGIAQALALELTLIEAKSLYPATWFNQGRYDDDLKEWQVVTGEKSMPEAPLTNSHRRKRKSLKEPSNVSPFAGEQSLQSEAIEVFADDLMPYQLEDIQEALYMQ